MNLIALETSSSRGGLALLHEGQLVASADFPAGLVHGRETSVHLDRLLRDHGRSPGDLDGIAVSRGPGSYTGIRVGVTIAKTLAYALEIPLWPICSLRVIAENARHAALEEGRAVCVVLDGKQGHLYRAVYRLREGHLIGEAETAVARAGDGGLEGLPPGSLVIGDGAELALGSHSGPTATGAERGDPDLDWPRAERLGALADSDHRDGVEPLRGRAVHGLQPVYLRVSEAERRFLARQRGAAS